MERQALEEAALPLMLEAMWAANVLDIQHTLRKVGGLLYFHALIAGCCLHEGWFVVATWWCRCLATPTTHCAALAPGGAQLFASETRATCSTAVAGLGCIESWRKSRLWHPPCTPHGMHGP